MSQSRAPTRMELLKLQKQRNLAERGHSLLEKKRDALIHTFLEKIETYKDLKSSVFELLQTAYQKLHLAQAISGVDVVRSIGQSQSPTFHLRPEVKNIMGVEVPQFIIEEKNLENKISLIGTSVHVQEAREAFQDVVQKVVRLHELQIVIETLAEEIQKTKRRVNSLEYVKIPQMENEEKSIKQHLDEMERESFTRLKKIKERL